MGRITSATDEQQKAVASMVDRMINPKQKPDGGSFTLGWDVVVSYSEENINTLLAERHAKDSSKMLKEITIEYVDTNPVTDEDYTTNYKLVFGPPLIQFNARNSTGPSCSLSMAIQSGTRQIDGGAPKEVPFGFVITTAGIPLGTAMGRIDSKTGSVNADEKIRAGSKTILFDINSNEQHHVVLNLPLSGESLVVSCTSSNPAVSVPKSPFTTTKFVDSFKKIFLDRTKVDALSYSIACVNNDSPKDGTINSLEPEMFQFACFTKGKDANALDRTKEDEAPITSLSIFIKTNGSQNTGTREGLQAAWQSQWNANLTTPIPYGFSAALLLNPLLVYNTMLQPGFKNSGWTTSIQSTDSGISLGATNTKDEFTTANGNVHYGWNNESYVWLEGFDIPLKDYQLDFAIKQESGWGAPVVYAKWHLQADCEWVDNGKFLGISFLNTTWGSGSVRLHYWLTKSKDDHSGSQQLTEASVDLNDVEFQLDIKLDKADWHLTHEQTPGTAHWYDKLDWPTRQDVWDNVMGRVKDLKPVSTVSGVGLKFLRTTNLLTPNAEVIDFNEGIGLKCPRDFLLVGDVLLA